MFCFVLFCFFPPTSAKWADTAGGILSLLVLHVALVSDFLEAWNCYILICCAWMSSTEVNTALIDKCIGPRAPCCSTESCSPQLLCSSSDTDPWIIQSRWTHPLLKGGGFGPTVGEDGNESTLRIHVCSRYTNKWSSLSEQQAAAYCVRVCVYVCLCVEGNNPMKTQCVWKATTQNTSNKTPENSLSLLSLS